MTDIDPIPFEPGQAVEDEVVITEELISSFAEFSGDYNPLHIDSAFASRTRFRRKVAHGMSYGSVFSRMIGMLLPGPGALWLSQEFRFNKPVFIGDRLKLRMEVASVSKSTRTMTLDCTALNQNGEAVLSGSGDVMVLESDADEGAPTRPQQRIALVAGASRGIGAAIAERLATDGFGVAITYRSSRDEAEAVVSQLSDGIALQADITDTGNAKTVIGQVRSRFRVPPDTLILCASDPTMYGAAADGDFSLFERQLRTQLAGAHALVSACLDHMIEQKFGVIIAIGSTYAEATPPTQMAPYVVAKAALTSYMKCLAVELGPKGIRANTVAPGMTETALISTVPDRQRKVVAAQTPLRRLAKPEDVASAVAFVVSDDAAYVNGHTFIVSGGNVM